MRLLFVCMGNICRSPAAEGVMKHLLKKAGLEAGVTVDSAGTIGLHAGKPPDARMIRAAGIRGITLDHRARQVTAGDIRDFDLVLVMDEDNLRDVRRLAPTEALRSRIRLFCDHCETGSRREVPDPYYGGNEGFELVLDLLEEGCARMLQRDAASFLPGVKIDPDAPPFNSPP